MFQGTGLFQNGASSPDTPASANTDGIYIADVLDYLQARQYYDPDCSPDNNCSGRVTFQIVTTGLMESFFDISADGTNTS